MTKIFKSSVLLRRIKKFEEAVVELSWLGSRHEDDHEEIQRAYKKARHNLISYILDHTTFKDLP